MGDPWLFMAHGGDATHTLLDNLSPRRISGFGFTGFVESRREYDALPRNMNVDFYKAAPSTYRL